MVELMGPDPVVAAHQVLTNVSLSLLPGQVACGRYPLSILYCRWGYNGLQVWVIQLMNRSGYQALMNCWVIGEPAR